MDLIITLLVAVIVFCLIYYLITILPLPEQLANARWVLFALLILAAIIWLLRFI
jgi:hypothetical protein